MNIHLSWDLFILVFFAIIIAYSFILGKDATLKIILGTYASALAADAAGNIFGKYFMNSKNFLKVITQLGLGGQKDAAIIAKVTFFVIFIILLTIKGSFSVAAHGGRTGSSRVFLTGIYGFLSAALIVSTVIMYVSGISFIAGSYQSGPSSIMAFTGQSPFVQNMLNYYNFWFLLPVLAIIIGSLVSRNEE